MPRSKEQFEEIKTQRKLSILEAALFIFAIEGYSGTTIDAICAKANCSHGLLYHYYKDKEHIWHDLFETIIQPTLRKDLASINLSSGPKNSVNEIINVFIKELKSSDDKKACIIYLLLNMHLQKDIVPKPKVKPKKDKTVFAYLLDLIKQGQDSGQFHKGNTKEILICLLSIFKGLSYTRIYSGCDKFICPSKEIITNVIY